MVSALSAPTCVNPERDMGSGPSPPGNYKNIGFLSNTGPDHFKNHKLPSQHSMLGHHRHASETPFKWRFAGGPTRRWPANSGMLILPPLIKLKKTRQIWTPSDKTFWIRVCPRPFWHIRKKSRSGWTSHTIGLRRCLF